MHAAFAPDRDFQPRGEGVGDRDADPVQAAGKRVGAAAAFVELAAGMQAGEYDFYRRYLFLRMHADWNAAAIILDTDAAVGIQGDQDILAKSAERFVRGVVNHFLNDMQRIFGAGVHARALLDRLQALQYTDR